jgi:serine/threonine protein kinase
MPQRNARVIGGVYRTGQLITAGGMLTTYTAYNHNTNDIVGLYVIELASPGQMQIVQQLQPALDKRRQVYSPHVIRVYDWGIDDNRIFIATDPPRGVTLQHIVDHENIDIPRAIDLTRQLAIGLQACHEQGVVGLDLRPQLITVDTVGVTDRIQIDDIGLRSLLRALGYVSSQRNDDIGYLDPRYAPPEYIHGGQVGPWSDIYQAGLHLFALVTGRLPFIGSTPAETGIMQSTNSVPPMSRYEHATPPMLQGLVEHALEKDPAKRFAYAVAFFNALSDVASPLHSKEHKDTPGSLIPSPSGTNLTAEMSLLQNDVTKRATHIERSSGIPQAATEKPIPNVPTEEGVYAYLCYEVNGDQPQRFALTQKSMIVGRLDPKRGVRPDIDLTPLDPTMTISRLHARIRFEETFFYIEDLKSRNKTRLGELMLTPLKAELLQHGDRLQFGSVHMMFEIPGMGKVAVFKKTLNV